MATNRTVSRFSALIVVVVASIALWSAPAFAARPAISEDRELKELDIASWDCRDRLEGSAKTGDGLERNRMKNRSPIDLAGSQPRSLAFNSFLQHVAAFDNETKGKRRKDLTPEQKEQLDALEKQIVSVTGYLVLAYAGPPETTNCGSTDFHDWHLELFDQPLDHAPEIGDPTPIICEITPRTQSALYRANVRLQALAAFIRAPDLTIEPTGHAARKIRVTGYLMWDDEHNGKADIGTAIESVGANKYHHPWRRTAWEIHPAIKIEVLDEAPVSTGPTPSSSPSSAGPAHGDRAPSLQLSPTPASALHSDSPPPSQQLVTVMTPVKIKILYGETTIPRGSRLRVVSHDAQTVTVSYLDGVYAIPISSTDFR
jgi:hypothetical protein